MDSKNESFYTIRNEIYRLLKKDYKYKLIDLKYKLASSKIKGKTITPSEVDEFIQ